MPQELELTELTIYAKAKIPVYQGEDGRLYTDAGTLTNPLFRLGDVPGEKGDKGEPGNPAIKLAGANLNTERSGVVLGLDIQAVNSALPLIGAMVVFRGLLKLVSTATGSASMQANIGGLIFTFPNITIAANSTQYVNFEVTVNVLSAAVGFASVRQSIALNGVAATAVQANNVAQSGAASTNTALIQFKSNTTTKVTTLFAVCEVL